MAAVICAAIVGGWGLVSGRDAHFAVADLPDDPARQGRCALWFIGSSSIHRWTTLGADMAPWIAHNRGVDGATIRAITTRFLHEPNGARPQAIIFYGGENDIAYGETAAAAIADLRRFLDAKARRAGDVPVVLLGLKPSPGRWSMVAEQAAFSRAERAIAGETKGVTFIDLAPRMMAGAQPGPYFVADGIHLNPAGYAIWREAVWQGLKRALPERVVGDCTGRRAGTKPATADS